jgi:1-deoxy-D-xylulose-5-phosphate synthase
VTEALSGQNVLVPVKRLGVPDILVDHAKPDESKADLGLLPAQMAQQIRDAFFSEQEVPVAGSVRE